LSNLRKNCPGGVAIPAGLEQDVDDLAVLVDGPPEVLTLAADCHEELVQMPRVANWPRPTPEPPCVGRTESLAPVPDGLVRHCDGALGEEVFDVAEAEGEAVVEPDGVADNRWREPVAWIVRDIVGHPATVPQIDNACSCTAGHRVHCRLDTVRHAIRENYRHSIACTATGDTARRFHRPRIVADDTL
jgi:hypothetical protein